MKTRLFRLLKGMVGAALLASIMGASCIKNSDGTYSLRIDGTTISNALKGKGNRWDGPGSSPQKDGSITVEGCWLAPGSASDSVASFMIAGDKLLFVGFEGVLTDEEYSQMIGECSTAHGDADNVRCCRLTFEGFPDEDGYTMTKFIKAEEIK